MNLLNLPFLGSFIHRLEKDTESDGIVIASRRALSYSQTKLFVQGLDTTTRKILESESVIIAANHPYEAEMFALLAAIPSRKDAYMIINANFTKLGAAIDRHLIPVYIQHNINVKKNRELKRKLLALFHPLELMHIDEARVRNRQSISHASERLNQGGAVMLFPARRSVTGAWYPGIGYMAHGAKKAKKLYFVGAHITGTSDLDYLRIFPSIGEFLPKITVTFSKPLDITKLRTKDPKEITSELEHYYRTYFHSAPTPE